MSTEHDSEPPVVPQDPSLELRGRVVHWLVQFGMSAIRQERLNVGVVVAVPMTHTGGVYVTVMMPEAPELDRIGRAFPDFPVASRLAWKQCSTIKSRILRDPYVTHTVFDTMDEVVAHVTDVSGRLANETVLTGPFTRLMREEEAETSTTETGPGIAKKLFDLCVKVPTVPTSTSPDAVSLTMPVMPLLQQYAAALEEQRRAVEQVYSQKVAAAFLEAMERLDKLTEQVDRIEARVNRPYEPTVYR